MAANKAVKSPAVSNSSASYCQVFTIQYALEVSKKYLLFIFLLHFYLFFKISWSTIYQNTFEELDLDTKKDGSAKYGVIFS